MYRFVKQNKTPLFSRHPLPSSRRLELAPPPVDWAPPSPISSENGCGRRLRAPCHAGLQVAGPRRLRAPISSENGRDSHALSRRRCRQSRSAGRARWQQGAGTGDGGGRGEQGGAQRGRLHSPFRTAAARRWPKCPVRRSGAHHGHVGASLHTAVTRKPRLQCPPRLRCPPRPVASLPLRRSPARVSLLRVVDLQFVGKRQVCLFIVAPAGSKQSIVQQPSNRATITHSWDVISGRTSICF